MEIIKEKNYFGELKIRDTFTIDNSSDVLMKVARHSKDLFGYNVVNLSSGHFSHLPDCYSVRPCTCQLKVLTQ